MAEEPNNNVVPMHPEDRLDLRGRVAGVMRRLNLSQKKISKEIGLSTPTISEWLREQYEGNNAAIEEKIAKWLTAIGQWEASHSPMEPDWFLTESADKILDVLTLGQVYRRMVCIYGGPGVGKTKAALFYKRSNPSVWIATMSPATSGVVSALEEIADAVGIRETINGARRLARAIRKRVEGTRGMLIIDETQHLSVAALEEIRAIHDSAKIGIALVGNESVYSRLTGGNRASHFAQLFRRISARLYLSRPTPDDVEALAEAWKIEGDEEIEFLTQLATKPGALGGCTNTLMLASMACKGSSPITIKHLRQAWANLGAKE